jgi:hypothetical protein
MTKILIGAIIAALMTTGCVETGDSTTTNTTTEYHGDYQFVSGGIDYGSGTPLVCNDANCSVVTTGDGVTPDYDAAGSADAIVGVCNENYNQVECAAAGFYYCELKGKCLNQRVDAASSSCNK